MIFDANQCHKTREALDRQTSNLGVGGSNPSERANLALSDPKTWAAPAGSGAHGLHVSETRERMCSRTKRADRPALLLQYARIAENMVGPSTMCGVLPSCETCVELGTGCGWGAAKRCARA